MESNRNYEPGNPEQASSEDYNDHGARQAELWQVAQAAPPEVREGYFARMSAVDRLAQRAEADPAAVVGADTDGDDVTAADVYRDAMGDLRDFKAEHGIH